VSFTVFFQTAVPGRHEAVLVAANAGVSAVFVAQPKTDICVGDFLQILFQSFSEICSLGLR
jgi:hypothetical protein